MLLVNTLPRLLAPRGFNGREKVVRAFQNYLATPAHLTASPMIHEQIAILTRYGIPPSEIARFETVRGFAILRNALPTAFWALYHVFADPALLAALREASTRLLTTAKTNAGGDALYDRSHEHAGYGLPFSPPSSTKRSASMPTALAPASCSPTPSSPLITPLPTS